MGQSQVRINKLRDEWLEDLDAQVGNPIIHIPLQREDKWFRGVAQKDIPELLSLWKERVDDENLNIICIDRFWVELIWETPNGTDVLREEFELQINLNRAARDNAIRTLERRKPKDWELHLKMAREGNWGTTIWGWLNRFLYCYPIDPKRKHNKAKIYPLVQVYEGCDRQPDQMTSFTFYDMKNTLVIKRSDDYEPPCKEELDIFRQCIKVIRG